MNSKILSTFAIGSIAATFVGLAFNVLALALFCIAASAMILLIAATDYAPRRYPHRTSCRRGGEGLPTNAHWGPVSC